MKHLLWYFLISDRNIDGNEKSFPRFQVCGNDAVTERSLPPNFGAYNKPLPIRPAVYC